ncbi:FkbM family methyltransferase, partial [Clostridium botulinum]|nr:FkbM family methyltransferase [Clostridium botulinum]
MNNIDIINIFKNYDEIKKIKKDVVIYGTGTLARDVYKFMINKGYDIKFFLNKSFNYINVVSDLGEIKKIDDNSITSYNKKNITVCIAAFTAYADIGRIIRDLLDFGYENIITYAELI